MPLYLCKPGTGDIEPWKHGVPVYSQPFAGTGDNFTSTDSISNEMADASNVQAQSYDRTYNNVSNRIDSNTTNSGAHNDHMEQNSLQNTRVTQSQPIRKVRHSELVLVDQVSLHFDRYWLRLRWPGSYGGVAGYILLGGLADLQEYDVDILQQRLKGAVGDLDSSLSKNDNDIAEEEEVNDDDSDHELTGAEPEPLLHNSLEIKLPPKCESTGLFYFSTATMRLLNMYDDGLNESSILPLNDETSGDENDTEPVFCRICREGLHDVDEDFAVDGQRDTAQETGVNITSAPSSGPAVVDHVNEDSDQNVGVRRRVHRRVSGDSDGEEHELENAVNEIVMDQVPSPDVEPILADQRNHPYAANPLMAPCECAGSMAFVHYLCVEQWRCRSNHPAAENGLNCETCKAKYTLPPPPSRPEANTDEDWMDAMPPHVLNALRHPHVFWQFGAAIVRRRWLRPLVPVFASPVVALYCRTRRTLKKRGVSRRRWACSLCRRRARWKCVRCLRSYYCSRQCQNVSWHIIHKHVCYKPSRFWQSVAVYGVAFMYFFPGVKSAPLVYDIGFSFLWASFVVSGIIGGGIATAVKRKFGWDLRGRALEAAVIALTFWLFLKCWGLIWAFFGEEGTCKGTLGYNSIPFLNKSEYKLGIFASLTQMLIINPGKRALEIADSVVLNLTTPTMKKWICTADNVGGDVDTCLKLAQKANPNFLLADDWKCRSDLNTVAYFWLFALILHCVGIYWKDYDRRRRLAAHVGRHPRPHQD